MKTSELVIDEPVVGADPVDPLAIPDLDELKGKGKSLQDKALKKYELLDERIRAMEGINILGSLNVT